jgi:hypothetical protein
MKHLTVLLLINLAPSLLHADSTQLSSTAQQTTLIELYSSEGCHSCPPADQFVSQFTESDELWARYIPVVFHVDYWDYLGWQDPYASAAFSNRQRAYKQQGHTSGVYTPGFVVNGHEWTGFFKPWRVLPETDATPGSLELNITGHQAVVHFPASHKLTYHLAVLGMGLASSVQAGENHGKQLTHDFVVLNHQSYQGTGGTTFQLPLIHPHQPDRLAVVSWVTADNDLVPLQAVGGWLPEGLISVL